MHTILQIEMKLPNGGYVKENGISLCNDCHEIVEMYPDDLYNIIGSSKELAIIKSNEL